MITRIFNSPRIFAIVPVLVNAALAVSPSLHQHLFLQTVVVVSGLLAGIIVWRCAGIHNATAGLLFALILIGISHGYVISSAAVADHTSKFVVMGEVTDVQHALWVCFIFLAISLTILYRRMLQKDVATS